MEADKLILMGRPTTLLEGLCGHALALGAQSIEVEYSDRQEWVFANKGDTRIRIANYKSSGPDAKELRSNLYAAAKKSIRTVVGGQVYILKARAFESFGEDSFAVSIDLAPTLDPSIAPRFTARQGQYLAFIYNYTKIHHQAPAESDLERYFRVSPPSIHEMIKTLERNGLIERVPRQARSIRLLVQPECLPRLE
jgi:DNA-binding MarR family transcriptional regulator